MNKLERLLKQKQKLDIEIAKAQEAQTNEELSDFFIRNCRFSLKCEQKWENLDNQNIDNIKYCNKCGQEVFLCSSKENVIEALHQNLCIAIPIILKDKKRVMLGSIVSAQE